MNNQTYKNEQTNPENNPSQNPNPTTTHKETLQESKSKIASQSEPRTNVRFSIEEFQQISNDAFVAGKSIPVLLKTTYFKNPFPAPLMSAPDQKSVLMELRRIGTNINQIAKQINSGFREGWNDDFILIRDSVMTLRRFVAGIYGDR